MKNKLLDIDKLQINDEDGIGLEIKDDSSDDIAIIGMSGRFASAGSIDEFWDILSEGKDCIRELPEIRKQHLESCIYMKYYTDRGCKYDECGFLDEIDKFDFEFFGISPMEAKYISPDHRVFLEVAWNAIEEAGYGGKKITGSNTGIYLGYSSDFGDEYKNIIDNSDEAVDALAAVGNIKSAAAGRLAYLFDLKGPSMLVDTACSSSLVAVHLACKALKNKECDMAIAGSVKLCLLPIIGSSIDGMGIRSSTKRAKTFDNSSDGTGLGEGAAAVLLKPLKKAIADGDHIHGIIKASAVNQDGSSAGMTAPNSAAQEELLLKAWREGGINPESITYLEAHGTGTKLGDPIEISGIQRAFSRYTQKKQFCAIGSVKTNVGHLDNAAGMASLIKAVLALKNKKIPATLHFKTPNTNISFESSPVFVNDKLIPWQTDGFKRRCGISAFALSGTNCHLILEEAADFEANTANKAEKENEIFTLSARNERVLTQLLNRYKRFLEINNNNIGDLCYTANTGRGHYSCRLALIVKDLRDLADKLDYILHSQVQSVPALDIFYDVHRIVSDKEQSIESGKISESMKREASHLINMKIRNRFYSSMEEPSNLLSDICRSYVRGAEIDWNGLYKSKKHKRVTLPVYPFEKTYCWAKLKYTREYLEGGIQSWDNDLLGQCIVNSIDRIIYSTGFAVHSHWVLNEHKVGSHYVVPGTTYIEMVRQAVKLNFPEKEMELSDVVFVTPLSVDYHEEVEVHTILKLEEKEMGFTIASRQSLETGWNTHAHGRIILLKQVQSQLCDMELIKNRCSDKAHITYAYEEGKGIETGPRWKNLQRLYWGKDEVLGFFSIPQEFSSESERYGMHPALLDMAMNMTIRAIGEGLYLPWVYKSIRIFRNMPGQFYCHLIKKKNTSIEAASFDGVLADIYGNVFAEITSYTIKKVANEFHFSLDKKRSAFDKKRHNPYHKIGWKPELLTGHKRDMADCNYIIFSGISSTAQGIAEIIKNMCRETIEVFPGDKFQKLDDFIYTIDNSEEAYVQLAAQIKERSINGVIHMASIDGSENNPEGIYSNHGCDSVLKDLFYLAKALGGGGIRHKLDIVVIGDYASEVTEAEEIIKPYNSARLGFASVIGKEHAHLDFRCIDTDYDTSAEDLIREITTGNSLMTAYRNGIRYVRQLQRIDMENNLQYEVKLKTEGIYVITGGLGGIGLELCKYLASKEKINLALINRTPMPDRDKWESILKEQKVLKSIMRIKSFKEAEELALQLECCCADVSDAAEMKETFDKLRRKYGRINGIIHAAGVAGDGFAAAKPIEVFEKVVNPKMYGTCILDKVTDKDKLDFFVMFSSISSFMPAAGQSDYTAANSFLDSFAAYRRKKGKTALTINWSAWKETGMAVDYGANKDGVFKALTTSRAIELLEAALSKNISNICLGELNSKNQDIQSDSLDFQLSQDIRDEEITPDILLRAENHGRSNVLDIKLTGKGKDEEYSLSERLIGNIWGTLLENTEINIYDSFFKLGGNSLSAVRFEVEMEKNNISLQYSDIIAYPTVETLAAYLDGNKACEDEDGHNIHSNISSKTTFDKSNLDEAALTKAIPAIKINEKNAKEGADNKRAILDNIEPFNEIIYKGCFYSAFLPAVISTGKNIISIIANDVVTYSFKHEKMEMDINYISQKPFNELMQNIGVYVSAKNRSEDIITDIKAAINLGRPVIVNVDCYYESIRQDTYMKVHWPHSILVYGYDEEAEQFNIIEQRHRESLYYEKMEINFSDIINAHNGFIENYRDVNVIQSSLSKLEYFKEEDTAAFFEISMVKEAPDIELDQIVNKFAHHILMNKTNVLDGLESIKVFSQAAVKILINEELLKDKSNEIEANLNKIINCKQMEQYRIAILFKEEKGLQNELRAIINEWSKIRSELLKYSYTGSYDENNFRLLPNNLLKLYRMEAAYQNKLIIRLENHIK